MNEMIERVARAIKEKLESLAFSGGPDDDKDQYLKLARAAIEAMREPTDQQRNNYFETTKKFYPKLSAVFSDAEWERMIDAALKEET